MIEIKCGDVLKGPFEKPTILVHICNDVGVMGAGIAKAIADKYPKVYEAYNYWYSPDENDYSIKPEFSLGEIQIVNAEPNLAICNLIGQKGCGIKYIDGEKVIPCKHECIREGLLRLRAKCKEWMTYNPSSSGPYYPDLKIISPLIGCGLSGSNIRTIYNIVDEVFGDSPILYTFYAFTGADYIDLKMVHDEFVLIRESDKNTKDRMQKFKDRNNAKS